MSDVQLRRAVHADIPRLKEIRAAVRENRLADPGSVTTEHYVGFIDRAAIWAFDEGGRVVGFGVGDTKDGSIWALFVDPACEGRGIGRALLDRVCADLVRAGHRLATLGTDPNTRAERFYRNHGWVPVGLDGRGEMIFHKRI